MKKTLKRIYLIIIPWGNTREKIIKLYTRMNNSYKKKRKNLAQFYCYLLERKYRCRISPGASIRSGLYLPHPEGVVIGEKAIIGQNVTIYQQVTIGQNHGKYPVIGDNVIVYAGAKIVGGIHIGDNCIVGANAVVTNDVPDDSIVGGIPAKVIKKHSSEEKYF